MGNGEPSPPGFLGNLSPDQLNSLQELRQHLLETCFPASGLEEEHLSIWGVTLHDMNKKDLTISQKIVLLKFLRSRDFEVERAASKLMKALQWRKTFKVAELGDEVFPKELDALCYNHGRDRNGRPVQYNIYAQLDPSRVLADEECIQRFIRWRVKIMEETIATMLDFENGIEDIVHVHDYSGVKLLRMDINFKTSTQKIIRVFGDYYPEMLSIKYFINVPRMAELLFNVGSLFVSPKTISKFRLCSQTGIRGALLDKIEPAQLPRAYGGFLDVDSNLCCVQTLKVSARSKAELIFQLDEGGELQWEFLTENLDVGVLARGADSNKNVCFGRKEYGHGKYKQMSKGPIVLTLDNSYSLFTEKIVWIKTKIGYKG